MRLAYWGAGVAASLHRCAPPARCRHAAAGGCQL